MGSVRQSFWRSLTAQVAVLLLALQSTLGVAACPHRYAFLDPFASGVLCAVNAPVASTSQGTPAQSPAQNALDDCAFCAAFCHAAVVLATEFVVPAPAGVLILTQLPTPQAVSITPHSPQARGPPAQILA